VIARVVITFNFLIRSTSLIVWPVLFMVQLVNVIRHTRWLTKNYLCLNVFHAVLSLFIAVLLDSVYFNRVTFTAYNFIDWNII
jgi:hypothetical protein